MMFTVWRSVSQRFRSSRCCGFLSQGEKSLSCLGVFVSGCAGLFGLFSLKLNFLLFNWHFSDHWRGFILFSELVGKMC